MGVRVLYTDDALYFGVWARDDVPAKLVVNDLKKDYNTGNSDGFRVVLDTFHEPGAHRTNGRLLQDG